MPRTIQAVTLTLLAVALLLAGATYWEVYRGRHSRQPTPPPVVLADRSESLSAENERLRSRVNDLEQDLDDATNRIKDLEARLQNERDAIAATSSPNPETAPPPLAIPSPEVRSGMDAERDRAAFLVPRFERLAQGAQRLATLQSDYQRLCIGAMDVTYRDSLGNPQAGTIDLAATPECVNRSTNMSALRGALSKEGAEIEEAARRASVLPGILRELVASYRLTEYLNP